MLTMRAWHVRRMNKTSPSKTAVRILLLAMAYVVTGRLALLLAIPPGFATAIFPPVGVGLAAVLLWGNSMLLGVLLGSTVLNVSISWSASGRMSWSSLLIAFGIAMGSSLHNAFAGASIRRFIGFPSSLSNEREVIGFLLLGGPIACLISATWGVSVLYLAGAVTGPQYGFSWWTWWVGDGIGVLIATPLVLILFAQPREIWARRLNTVGIPLLIGCAVMVAAFIRASRLEQDNITTRFDDRSRLMASLIKSHFKGCSEVVLLVERFVTAASRSGRSEFATFVSKLRAAHPEIQATEWVAFVRADERAEFEHHIAAEGFPRFVITEKNDARELVPANAREAYAVITYVEPFAGNEKAFGYDLLSESTRRATLLQAQNADGVTMTSPIRPIQGGIERGVLLLYPVYSATAGHTAERRASLRGFINVLVDPKVLVESALVTFEHEEQDLRITDVTDPAQPRILVGSEQDGSTNSVPFLFRDEWQVGGRSLEITIAPTQSFIRANRSLQAWVVLAGGLGLCGLLGAFLLIMSGRTVHVEQLVQQRTLELSAVLDNAAEAIITFNTDGYIERANPATAKLFEMTVEKLLQCRITELLPQIDWNSAPNEGDALEVRGYCLDGTPLALEMMLSRMEVNGRNLFTVMLHDISARKRAERLKNEFISTVSHELRTPLTSISGSLGLIAGGVVGDISDEVRELIDIAKINAEQLKLLVDDILDIDKLAAGKLDVIAERTDLCVIVRQSLVQNRGYAERHGVSLVADDTRFSKTPVIVEVDPARILQVMANLISNAIKFSPPGAVVDVSLEVGDDDVKVSVRDQGSGVPDDFRERIFEKFAQADGGDNRARGGTGLGLSIAKALVERFGGAIDYVSSPGRGSTFFFQLPLAKSVLERAF